jgi:ubiquinone/menaquinone biosynthesis C-methylase UbiE
MAERGGALDFNNLKLGRVGSTSGWRRPAVPIRHMRDGFARGMMFHTMDIHQLLETREAFDRVARTYDATAGSNRTLDAFRERTIAPILARVPADAHLLDLGCGSGIDAIRMAKLGYRVTALDWAPRMVERTQDLARDAGVSERVTAQVLGIHELGSLPPASFDAAYSDLGPLNCVPDLAATAGAIARVLKPGGLFSASIMGRLVPWELLLYVLRGDLRRARMRLARSAVAVPLDGATVWTRYYSPSTARQIFADSGFAILALRALGVLVPPPYLSGFHTAPRVMNALQMIEDRIATWPPFCHWGDHFLIVARRQA